MRLLPLLLLLIPSVVAALGTKPPAPACSYTYSAWGACSGGQQTRTAIATPTPCAGTPVLSQTCATPPGPPPLDSPVPGARYLSPAGNDSAACTLAAPCKSFVKAFSGLPAGGEVVLLSGVYSSAISYTGAGAAQAPSGLSLAQPTVVRALNPGTVTVPGLFVGRSTRKDKFIRFEGITFKGGASLYNADFVTLKNVGVNGPLSVGTNDHAMGSNDNLIEDVWVWAAGSRIVAINYRANRNVWRRVVVRGDGCGTSACSGSGNPNVGITIYDSQDVSFQNVVVVDRILAPTDSPYADLACAAHSGQSYPFGRNEWLGAISRNSPDLGYYCEPDVGSTLDRTVRVENMRIAGRGGFNLARAGTNNTVEGLTVAVSAGDGIRIAPELTSGTLKNVSVSGSGRYAINSKYKPESTRISGTWQSQYNQTTCSVGCGTGSGATVQFRYGVDGTRHGEAGYNALSTVPLWPWPNEARIKAEMCASVTRGFCSMSLTDYILGLQ